MYTRNKVSVIVELLNIVVLQVLAIYIVCISRHNTCDFRYLSAWRSGSYVPCFHLFKKKLRETALSGIHGTHGTWVVSQRHTVCLLKRGMARPKSVRRVIFYYATSLSTHNVMMQQWINSLIHFIFFRTSYQTEKRIR